MHNCHHLNFHGFHISTIYWSQIILVVSRDSGEPFLRENFGKSILKTDKIGENWYFIQKYFAQLRNCSLKMLKGDTFCWTKLELMLAIDFNSWKANYKDSKKENPQHSYRNKTVSHFLKNSLFESA